MLSAGVAISIVIMLISSITGGLIQAVLLIAGMGILGYSSHALSHCIVSRILGVDTLYFYVGKSEMRKLKSPISGFISKYLFTIGTKLDRRKFATLTPGSRALIMGSGAIIPTALLALILSLAFIFGFGVLSLVLGGLFFLSNLSTEIFLSVKVGDLKKMKDQLSASTL